MGGVITPKWQSQCEKIRRIWTKWNLGNSPKRGQNLFLKRTWQFVKKENKDMITARIGTSFLIQSIQSLWLHMYIYINMYIIYIWVNHNDLTATSLEQWLVRDILFQVSELLKNIIIYPDNIHCCINRLAAESRCLWFGPKLPGQTHHFLPGMDGGPSGSWDGLWLWILVIK